MILDSVPHQDRGPRRRRIPNVARLVSAPLILVMMGTSFAANDPKKVVGPEQCVECHMMELPVLERSHHYRGFFTMHRQLEAKEIGKRLGIRRVKRDPLCQSCHYTAKEVDGKVKPISGVSCESCHGAARDWLEVHSDSGEAETESEAHQRRDNSAEAGMTAPFRVYGLVSKCYGCHTVADERLVNIGGHPSGSAFELVAWTQGEIRHNYFYSKDKKNREASAERKRVLYVFGRALELEHALRALAKASHDGEYGRAMHERAKKAIEALRLVHKRAPLKELEKMLQLVDGLTIELGQGETLVAAADRLQPLARHLGEHTDGALLAPIDDLLPKRSSYRGKALP